jgi:hypothetical protein
MEEIIEEKKELSNIKKFRDEITALEKALRESDNDRITFDRQSKHFPLKHTITDGVYVRQMNMKKGSFVLGAVHKRDHVWFLLTGYLIISNENGFEDYQAPCYVEAKSGAQRAIFATEDSIFVTIHKNPDDIQNIQELEEYNTCNTYVEYEKWIAENKLKNI